MIYALIGIPFTLFLLSVLVGQLMRPVNLLLEILNSRLGHLHSPLKIRCLHLSLVSSLVLLLLLLLPALLLDLVEPVWSFFDSLYYCFISLTTVGLGDFIPGDDPEQKARSVYKTFVTVYLILGLVGVMTLVSIVTTSPELDLTSWFRPDLQAVSWNIYIFSQKPFLHPSNCNAPSYSLLLYLENLLQSCARH